MALESDDKNADSRLSVVFYSKTVPNDFRTNLEGRPIFEDVDYVTISIPGDITTVLDVPVHDGHKKRFPMHWQHYQNKHGNDVRFTGTPLTAWPILSNAQSEELRALKFHTVEQIATASDQQLQRIGMVAGMNTHQFRDRAKRFLDAAKDEAVSNKQAEEISRLNEAQAQSEARHRQEMEELKAQIAAMAHVTIPAKRGPKPKVKNGTHNAPAGAAGNSGDGLNAA